MEPTMAAQDDKTFTKESSPEAIETLFKRIASKQSWMTIWVPGSEPNARGKISELRLTKRELVLAMEKNAEMKESIPTKVLGRISTESDFAFFETQLIETIKKGTDQLWAITYPKMLHLLTRRQKMRYVVPADQQLWVTFIEPKLRGMESRRRVRDLSEGGLGVDAILEDEPVLHSGELLPHIQLTLRAKKLALKGIVRHCGKHPKGIRVGIEFQETPVETVEWIRESVERLLSHQFSHIVSFS